MSIKINSREFSGGCIDNQTHPWRDEEILEELYHGWGLTLEQCANKLGCSRDTVRYQMRKHGLERRDREDTDGWKTRVERATFAHDGGGHEQWVASDGDGSTKTVHISQLTAIAHGADPHTVFSDKIHVHHRNSHPFDNRHTNLEVVTVSEHRQIHSDENWVEDSGLGCQVLNTTSGEE
jgi:hypothetical protein